MKKLLATLFLSALSQPALAGPAPERRPVPARVLGNTYTCSYTFVIPGYQRRTFTHTKRKKEDAAVAVYGECVLWVEDQLRPFESNPSIREERGEQACVEAYPTPKQMDESCRLNRAV